MEKHTDPRKYAWFKARDGSAAALGNGINSKLGIITYIGKGGLTFRYIDFDPDDEKDPNGPMGLSIIRNIDGFFLDNMPCKIIEENCSLPGYFLSSLKMSECRVQFGELTPHQASKLEYFLENFTEDYTSEAGNITAG